MSHQLSECPNCRRIFIGGTAAPQPPAKCRVCGVELVAPGQKEAEVQNRLYGRHLSTESVTRVSSPAKR